MEKAPTNNEDNEQIKFPIIVGPGDGSRQFDIFIVNTQEEYGLAVERLEAQMRNAGVPVNISFRRALPIQAKRSEGAIDPYGRLDENINLTNVMISGNNELPSDYIATDVWQENVKTIYDERVDNINDAMKLVDPSLGGDKKMDYPIMVVRDGGVDGEKYFIVTNDNECKRSVETILKQIAENPDLKRGVRNKVLMFNKYDDWESEYREGITGVKSETASKQG